MTRNDLMELSEQVNDFALATLERIETLIAMLPEDEEEADGE